MKKLIVALLLISTPAFAEVQYKTGDTPNTTRVIGTMPVFLDAGVVTPVSDAAPLPVSAVVNVPAGGATLAAQATGNTSLASIDGKITAVNTGAVLQATGSTIKAADRAGNVYTGTLVGNGYLLDVNVRSGTPTTMAVTNAGVFAVQNTEATGSSQKILTGAGTVFDTGPGIASATATMRVFVATGSTTILQDVGGNRVGVTNGGLNINTATGSLMKIADSSANAFTGTLVGTDYALDTINATGSTQRAADRNGNIFTGSVTTGGNYAMDVKTATGSTIQTATGSVTQAITGVDGGWLSATQSTLSTVVQQIKNTKGNFGGYFFYNPNSSAAYLQVFDSANAAGCTLTTLKMICGLPSTAGANMEWSRGISMNNGIFVRVATTATGNTAPSSPIEGFVAYK